MRPRLRPPRQEAGVRRRHAPCEWSLTIECEAFYMQLKGVTGRASVANCAPGDSRARARGRDDVAARGRPRIARPHRRRPQRRSPLRHQRGRHVQSLERRVGRAHHRRRPCQPVRRQHLSSTSPFAGLFRGEHHGWCRRGAGVVGNREPLRHTECGHSPGICVRVVLHVEAGAAPHR